MRDSFKLALMTTLTICSAVVFAQVPMNFIGQTQDQVEAFLEKQILEDDWDVEDLEDGGKWIYVSDGSMTPAFNWYFDKEGKCYHHSFKVEEGAPVYLARFKQSKLRHDAKGDRWIDDKSRTAWKVDGQYVVAERI